MKALQVEGTLHWGYSVKGLEVSKLQFSLRVPPPTTLVGALIYPLARRGLISIKGEITRDLSSPVEKYYDIFRHSAFAITNGLGYYYEDINVYIILHFIGFQKDAKTNIPRRYLSKFRRGAILTGKIYAPSADFSAIYIFDEKKAKQKLGDKWLSLLKYAGWNITRIGSKESIVSIKRADIVDIFPLNKEVVKTFYYFPAICAKKISEESVFYKEKFWQGGFGRKQKTILIDYIIPGTKNPVEKGEVYLELSDKCKAYQVGGEVVVYES